MKQLIIGICIISMAFAISAKPVTEKVVKADTVKTVKVDTLKTIKCDTTKTVKIDTTFTVYYDTLKLTKQVKDTAVVTKIDTAVVKDKKRK
jgi:hypothetical protein